MNIEVDGIQYSEFVAMKLKLHLDAICGAFGFDATSDFAQPMPFRGGEGCKILVDGEKQLTGWIEQVHVDGDSKDHSIKISGRGLPNDFVDSKIGSLSDLNPPISLKRIIQRVITHIGANLIVIDDLNPDLFTSAEDIAAPDPGQGVMEFVESLARKRQALITSNADGDIVITRASGTIVDVTIKHRVADNSNNVLKYSVGYDSTNRYRTYKIFSQLNPTSLNLAGTTGTDEVVHQSAEAEDVGSRDGRQFALISESQSSSSYEKDRAIWEANVRRARSQNYAATVNGFRNDSGELWKPNTIVKVDDQYAGINSPMLINAVEFSYTRDEGRRTMLSFVDEEAYTLKLSEPVEEKIGDGLTSGLLPGITPLSSPS